MLDVSGLNPTAVNGSFAPTKRKNDTPLDVIIKKVEAQRALDEWKEIEAIKQKPKEERTFAEKARLANYQAEKTLAALEKLPTVVYVA